MEGGCTDVDVADAAGKACSQVGWQPRQEERRKRWRDFVQREAKPTRDSRPATTGPAPVEQPACDSILTIMELTVNPGPTNIPLHWRIWRTLFSFG